ncbi:DNA-directed RNA polymerase sigma-70 factor [Clostridia bacterium]|nr:DNA-directed RNA polymerase sigma-70 factor [Clostridia bacterium]GHV09262.1 DNA-directed RNA polymerase sigma-70 factor [Clostridia bacterium]
MEPYSQESVQHRFDSFCKTVLRNEARNHYAEDKRRREREINFSTLSEQDLAQFVKFDEYPTDSVHFNVLGYPVAVKDDAIAAAIAALPCDRRDIILLSYFLDMTDTEIADKLKLVRSTVQYRRARSLRELKNFMEEENAND